MDIPRVIRETMEAHETQPAASLEAILESDRWAREHSRESVIRVQRAGA
jgi:1-deoxy-D-xylulose 5-phosphate reductoisomerase